MGRVGECPIGASDCDCAVYSLGLAPQGGRTWLSCHVPCSCNLGRSDRLGHGHRWVRPIADLGREAAKLGLEVAAWSTLGTSPFGDGSAWALFVAQGE